jgi:cell division protease FtsH
MFPPEEDRSNETESRLREQIAASLGGQAAESLVFKDISTGASSDIEAATKLARAMVTQYGMSTLGPINLQSSAMFGVWSKGGEEGAELSPELKNAIDKETKRILDDGMKLALSIIKKHRSLLDKVAKELLEKETLEGEEFEKIVGKKVQK